MRPPALKGLDQPVTSSIWNRKIFISRNCEKLKIKESKLI